MGIGVGACERAWKPGVRRHQFHKINMCRPMRLNQGLDVDVHTAFCVFLATLSNLVHQSFESTGTIPIPLCNTVDLTTKIQICVCMCVNMYVCM